MSAVPRVFLEQKLRETLAEYHVPALAAALVRDGGATMVSAQQGVRKLGASGAANAVTATDKFNLGSISKVFTGNLVGKLIQDGVGGLSWTTRLGDALPELWAVPPARDGYKNVTVEQLLAHVSGMPYTPKGDDLDDWKTYTPLDTTKPKLIKRRRKYTLAAVLDAPSYWPPGSGFEYSGGGIIAASIAEKITGKTYEDLVRQHLFNPLGMTHSGFGVMSPGALDGPWQHRFDPDTLVASPDPDTHLPGFSWHCRTPVGGVCSSAADLARFMREQLRDDPVLFSKTMRKTMQTQRVSSHSDFVRGAWATNQPGPAPDEVWHNGDNGVSYAHMSLRPARKLGMVAMSNMNSKISAGAVHEMHEVMATMHAEWSTLFGAGSAATVECVHPMPALAGSGSQLMLFARRHDGRVLRRRSVNGGASWSDAGDFGAVALNSGVAAASSADGRIVYVIGRGLDNKAWFGMSVDGGAHWQGWWPIRAGVFTTGAAIACSDDGQVVHAVGIGNDDRMWRTRSRDAGRNWTDWTPIGAGVFTSAPAIATSADGRIVHVAARGNDWRAWRNVSTDGGDTFLAHWQPVGKGVFSSGPGMAVSANGQRLHLMARGLDRQMWRNTSANAGQSWQAHWQTAGNGTFTSAPTLSTDAAGQVLDAYAFGGDFRIWGARSTDAGQTWPAFAQKGPQLFI